MNKKLTALLLTPLAFEAEAELRVSSQTDERGKPQWVVKNPHQEGLPPAQLGISPAVVKEVVSVGSGRLDKSVTFYNYNDKPKKIKLTLLDHGKSPSMKGWTLVNPMQFSLAGQGYQTIRLSFRLPQGVKVGNYKAMLMIEQIVAKPEVTAQAVKMEIGSRYGLPLSLEVKP